LQSFGDLVPQQPSLPDIGWVALRESENFWQRFEDLVLQQPGFHKAYQVIVNWLSGTPLASTHHSILSGHVVLLLFRFPDPDRTLTKQ